MKQVPDSIEIGWYHNEEFMMNTKLTLCFLSDGKAYLEYDDYCPGISAGNSMGGTYRRPVPDGFPKGWTLEDFAESLPRYHDVILKNEKLKEFFKKWA